MDLDHDRRGSGRPLLLVHGLGSNRRTWAPIRDELAAERETIALDLPGHGESPPLAGRPTFEALTDAVAAFQARHGLEEADLVGSSLGARIVVELSRRGAPGAAVALDPGGFWTRREVRYFQATLGPSILLVRAIRRAIPALTATAAGRTALLLQFSARPWALPAELARLELTSLAETREAGRIFRELVAGPTQAGAQSTPGRLTLGWGRQDRVCLTVQAGRAQARFPQAHLHWFERCGHCPHWDVPRETVELILDATRTQ